MIFIDSILISTDCVSKIGNLKYSSSLKAIRSQFLSKNSLKFYKGYVLKLPRDGCA